MTYHFISVFVLKFTISLSQFSPTVCRENAHAGRTQTANENAEIKTEPSGVLLARAPSTKQNCECGCTTIKSAFHCSIAWNIFSCSNQSECLFHHTCVYRKDTHI